MTTPLSSSSQSSVLFESEHTFKVWRYGVGHSQLLLRAAGDDDTDFHGIDLLFEGVDFMQLATRYEGLEVHSVGVRESQKIYRASGLDPKWRRHRLIVALRSASVEGYVQCQRVTAVRGIDDAFSPEDLPQRRDVMWSMRCPR